MAKQKLEYLLVGDHLGQVKKVLLASREVCLLTGCALPSSSNPVVSIEPMGKQRRQLIANKNGDLYIYDPVEEAAKVLRETRNEALIKALPILGEAKKVLLVYDKQVVLSGSGDGGGDGDIVVNNKKGEIKNAKVYDERKLAFVGKNIPLKLFDIEKKSKIFEADPAEKDWLGIKPDVFVAGLDFVGRTRIATCSKSDSVIRIYDTQGKSKPVISADINHTAFNEYADAARFYSVASTGEDGHTIVVGSNVGQILAIDLRFNIKEQPKKRKLRPRTYKILGGFKGARGASIKDIKIVPAGSIKLGREGDKEDELNSSDGSDDAEEETAKRATTSAAAGWQVVSCCLDRYLRIHNFNRRSRQLDGHVYMTTKPLVVSACVD